MKDENEKNFTLIIPADVKTRLELINGVGVKEMTKAGITFVVSLFCALIINLFFNNFLVVVAIVLLSTSFSVILTMKDKNHQSLADIIGNMIKFYKEQKFYPYEMKER